MFIKDSFDSAELQGEAKREVHINNPNRRRIIYTNVCRRDYYVTEKFYYTEVETDFTLKNLKK